jgi:hypothetical protein
LAQDLAPASMRLRLLRGYERAFRLFPGAFYHESDGEVSQFQCGTECERMSPRLSV